MADTVNFNTSAAASAVKMMDQLKSTLMFMAQSSAASTNQMAAAAAEFSKLNKTMNEMKRLVSTLTEMLINFNATAATSSSSGVSGLSRLFSTFVEQGNAALGKLKGVEIGERSFENILVSAAKAVGAELLRVAADVAALSIKGALKETQVKDMLHARTGSKEKGDAIFNTVRKQAVGAGMDPNEVMTNTMGFLAKAQKKGQYEIMTALAIQLSALDPKGGDTAKSSEAMISAMNGDMTLLTRQYGISPEAVEGFDPQKFINNSDMDGFLTGLNQVFENAHLGQAALKIVYDSPQSQLDTIINNLKTSLSGAGMEAVGVLSPLIANVLGAFDSGKFQGFFDILNMGLTIAAHLLSTLGQAALWVATTFSTYWPAIAAVLLMLGTLFIPTILTGLWAMLSALWLMVQPLLVQVGLWLATFWPILILIAVIGIFLAVLISLGATVGEIVGVIVGAFYALGAVVADVFLIIWNGIIAFIEGIYNAFILCVNFLNKVTHEIMMIIYGAVYKVINLILEGINSVIEAINSVTGKEIQLYAMYDESSLDGLKPTVLDSLDLGGLKANLINPNDAFDAGFNTGKNGTDKLIKKAGDMGDGLGGLNTDLGGEFTAPKTVETPGGTGMPGGNNGAGAAGMGAGKTPDIANVNKVDEVGKVNDTVDIASEDLKTMRELAEMKNIQNFVSLQPTVSVQTGDINNGTDIDTIIGRIERSLNEQIASSAEGVYA